MAKANVSAPHHSTSISPPITGEGEPSFKPDGLTRHEAARLEKGKHMRAIRGAIIISIVGLLLAVASGPASAGPIVDPNTLTPVPPPGAVCRSSGERTLCHTVFIEEFANEPAFELPCGTVYETTYDPRTGLRWYFDGLLVKRQVFSHADGFWSLSPTGDEPRVRFTRNRTWTDIYTIPGDEDSAVEVLRGLDVHAFLPGGMIQVAGRQASETDMRGVFRFADSPEVADALCEALGG
jgi:hypothetical protein